MSCEGCTEDADSKFEPNEEESYQESSTNGDSVLDFFYFPQDKLTYEASTEQQDASSNKIDKSPFHFACELHRYQWYEQEKCYSQHNGSKSFVLNSHNILFLKSTFKYKVSKIISYFKVIQNHFPFFLSQVVIPNLN